MNTSRHRMMQLAVIIVCVFATGIGACVPESGTSSTLLTEIPLTVTAVLSANTQIAALRTATISATETAALSQQPGTATELPEIAVSETPAVFTPEATTATSLPTIGPTTDAQEAAVEAPAASPASTVISTAGDAPEISVILMYDENSFTLYNPLAQPIDITQLVFANDNDDESQAFRVTRWDNGFLTAALDVFPAGGCLMAWRMELEEQQPTPQDCEARHAWIAVNFNNRFWLSGDSFEVRWANEVLAECDRLAGFCEVLLP